MVVYDVAKLKVPKGIVATGAVGVGVAGGCAQHNLRIMNITCAGIGDVLGKENGKSADGEIRLAMVQYPQPERCRKTKGLRIEKGFSPFFILWINVNAVVGTLLDVLFSTTIAVSWPERVPTRMKSGSCLLCHFGKCT